jgi:hypothetical protein
MNQGSHLQNGRRGLDHTPARLPLDESKVQGLEIFQGLNS